MKINEIVRNLKEIERGEHYDISVICGFGAEAIIGLLNMVEDNPGLISLKTRLDKMEENIIMKEYELYGPEWEKEMMRLDKKTLISMLKAKGLAVQMDNNPQIFSTDQVLRDIEFLAQRAKHAGAASFSKERETGLSSNAIVSLAYLGEPVKHLPLDFSDLLACEGMFEKLPEHRKTRIVLNAMEQARAAVRQTGGHHGQTT